MDRTANWWHRNCACLQCAVLCTNKKYRLPTRLARQSLLPSVTLTGNLLRKTPTIASGDILGKYPGFLHRAKFRRWVSIPHVIRQIAVVRLSEAHSMDTTVMYSQSGTPSCLQARSSHFCALCLLYQMRRPRSNVATRHQTASNPFEHF